MDILRPSTIDIGQGGLISISRISYYLAVSFSYIIHFFFKCDSIFSSVSIRQSSAVRGERKSAISLVAFIDLLVLFRNSQSTCQTEMQYNDILDLKREILVHFFLVRFRDQLHLFIFLNSSIKWDEELF